MPFNNCSEMRPSDIRKWAKEEIMDAIDMMIAKKREDHDLEYITDEQALIRERDRVAKFLGVKSLGVKFPGAK